MSIESRSRQYGKVFDHWQIGELLGSGSGGQTKEKTAVFKLSRIDSSRGKSALKVINLIEEKGHINALSAHRRNEYEQAKGECKKSAEQEVWLMNELQGNTNIVGYLDHTFVDWQDSTGFGYDMLIRMELLEDLRSKLRDEHHYSEKEILKIGRDVCTALVLCHNKGIIHRDIKPENIFINADGNYKLGDFGISRILSAAPSAMASSGVGTPEYAAPEQFMRRYDKRVDIYSLGLVLYELSNRNRLPFATSAYAHQEDIQKRQMGTPLLKPEGISIGLWKVIQKACAYKAADRYNTAQEFLEALCLLDGTSVSSITWKPNKTVKASSGADYSTRLAQSHQDIICGYNTLPAEQSKTPVVKSKTGRKVIRLVAVVLAILLIVIGGFRMISNMKREATIKEDITGVISIADDLAAGSNFLAALDKIEEGLSKYPDSGTLQEKKDVYTAAIDEDIANIISDADILASTQDYDSAISVLNAGLVTYPESDELKQKKLAYADAMYAKIKADTLAQADAFASSGDYLSAIKVIQDVQETYGNDVDYQNAYNKYCREYKTDSLSSADMLATEGNYYAAYEVVIRAMSEIGDDAEFTIKAYEYENADVAEITKQIEQYLNDSDYKAAEKLISEASKNYPDNRTLIEEKERVKRAKPVDFLTVCPPYRIELGEAWTNRTMGGTKYLTGISVGKTDGFVYFEGIGYALFNLDGKYNKLTFDVGNIDDLGSPTNEELYIYLDGDVVWSHKLDPEALPQNYSIDVSGAKQMKIVGTKWAGDYGIANMKVTLAVEQNNEQETAENHGKQLLSVCSPHKTEHYEEWSYQMMGGKKYSSGISVGKTHGFSYFEGEGYAIFNLSGKYTEFAFDVGNMDSRGNPSNQSIYIFLDDELIYTIDLDPEGLPQHHTIDVTGATKMKIVGTKWAGDYGMADLRIS